MKNAASCMFTDLLGAALKNRQFYEPIPKAIFKIDANCKNIEKSFKTLALFNEKRRESTFPIDP